MKRLPIVYSRDLSGKDYWRSLGERDGSPEFAGSLAQEFPEGASEPPSGVSRRSFLSVMAAATALATLEGCRRPEEKILPYAHAPEEVVPGNALHYATAISLHGTAFGLLVESHEGRPTKVEGNPRHPDSLGATGLFAQASVLDLYDPDRSDAPREKGQRRSWDEASAALRSLGAKLRSSGGKGLAILTEAHRSPTLAAALADLQKAMPQAKVVRYEPFTRHHAKDGAKLALGRPYETIRDLTKARVILAIDSDLLATEGSTVKHARGFAEGRKVEHDAKRVSRMYAVESAFTITGANADHRLRLQSSQIPAFVFALAGELSAQGVALGEVGQAAAAQKKLDGAAAKWAKAVAKDLSNNRGMSLVVAGDKQPAVVHAVVHAINAALQNVSATLYYAPAFDDASEGPQAMVDLAKAVASKAVDTVVILGGNPAFDAPADADFAKALAAAATVVHLSSRVDETGALATWHLNRAHYLEAWDDVRAEDGTASIVQPLIAPLYDGKTDAEVVRILLGDSKKAYDLVRATWATAAPPAGFEKQWRRWLHQGVIEGSVAPPEAPAPKLADVAASVRAYKPADGGFEVTFAPDPHVYDGRFANNAWLQEFPDPMLKLTWGNAAWVSPATAKELGLKEGDLVSISAGGAAVEVPAIIAPGQADQSVLVTVGHGRTAAGRVGNGVGVNTYPARTSAAFHVAAGAKVSKGSGHKPLARTQEHFAMEGRPLVREATVAEFTKDPEFVEKLVEEHPPLFALWGPHPYEGHKWGMAIDLNACTGCGVCMIACQAENNIPSVGFEGITMSREMHWIRVDRYYEGDEHEPRAVSQPMTCQQCENAPCEQVCPVGATTHSPEGLNDMAYNRCIGTKYCGNNCPFKVRRFNYFNYQKDLPEQRKMQFNPDVTVRARGVMEKCTFCVQRINEAKIGAKRDGRDRIRDGEAISACQQACPTQAIAFGDLNDPASKVARKNALPIGYKLLEELNIRPRITYLAKIRNPNPELETA